MKKLIVCLTVIIGVMSAISIAGQDFVTDYHDYKIEDKYVNEVVRYDTVEIDLPYAEIKDKNLRSLIDSLKFVDDDRKSFKENVFIYLFDFGNSYFAAWVISPVYPPMSSLWGIAYYKVGNLYVVLSPNMRKYLRLSTDKVASMTLLVRNEETHYNIDYIWTGTTDKRNAKYNRNTIRIDPVHAKLDMNKVTEHVSEVRGVRVRTPYGEMEFSDDDNSSRILHGFANASGNYYRDSLNTRAIISVCDVADGALADMMGNVSLDDFLNKPKAVIDIYADDEKTLERYIGLIAGKLYLDDESTAGDNTSSYDAFVDRLQRVITDRDDFAILSRIISKIKDRYMCYKSL